MAYARHQSFYLRDKWISKGLKSVKYDSRFFYQIESPEQIGVGKNMLVSIKFWLVATGLIEENRGGNKTNHFLTGLGEIIYQNDRLLENQNTISILHYNLVFNSGNTATVFDWFFNKFLESATTRELLLNSFESWVKKNDKNVSKRSLKKDVDCLVQLYTKYPDEEDPEDVIFSPFSSLILLKEESSENGHEVVKKLSGGSEAIGMTALYYSLIKYANYYALSMVSLDEILNGEYLWGKVFNLRKEEVIEILNKLVDHDKYPLEYVRTNNLDNVKLPVINENEFLKSEYYALGVNL